MTACADPSTTLATGCHRNGSATSWNITHTGAVRRARAATHAANGKFIALRPNACGTY